MKVFISYRRSDSAATAGRLHDHLSAKFGNDALFIDVDSMVLGQDWKKQIVDAVTECDVLLAVIGPGWLNARDDDGNRRLDDPEDIVRLEILTALERSIPVIPILLDGTSTPKAHQLPEDLKKAFAPHGLDVRNASFRRDIEPLEVILRKFLPVGSPIKSAQPRDVLDDSEKTFRMFVWYEPEDAIFAKDLCSELSNFLRPLLDSSARDQKPVRMMVTFDLDMKPESLERADFLLMLSPQNNMESSQRSEQIRLQFLRHWEHEKEPSLRVEHVVSRTPSLLELPRAITREFQFHRFIRPDGHLIKNDSSALIVRKLGNCLFGWVLNFSHPERKKR